MPSAEPSAYDQELAATLEDDEEATGLRERLLAGEASEEDRRAARERLDPSELRRFELAHPIPPRDVGIEVDGGEVEMDLIGLDSDKAFNDGSRSIRERLAEAVGDDPPEREVVVQLSVRLKPPAE